MPKFSAFITSGKFLEGTNQPTSLGCGDSLDTKLRRTQARVKTLIQSQEVISKILGDQESLKARNMKKKFNQQLNKIHKTLVTSIVNEAELEEVHFKTMKHQFTKDIVSIEDAYDASINHIIHKPLESIKEMDLGKPSGRLFKRCATKKITGKIIHLASQ